MLKKNISIIGLYAVVMMMWTLLPPLAFIGVLKKVLVVYLVIYLTVGVMKV